MSSEIVDLNYTNSQGDILNARFSPFMGMNLVSFKKNKIEVIDQSTRDLFEERYAGLGAMIGPHFHHRSEKIIPKIPDESLFPHIAKVKARGVKDPFSHGIGRYAPWKVEFISDQKLVASLSGKDEWKGILLKDIEGQNFKMIYQAELLPEGLSIYLSVVSDFDSVVGLHTYYALSQGQGRVIAQVQPFFFENGEKKPIPTHWNYSKEHLLIFDLQEEADFGFLPFSLFHAEIEMHTQEYSLRISYESNNQENSWQLWHPKGKSFVCIEPLSAKNPRKPILSASELNVLISIF